MTDKHPTTTRRTLACMLTAAFVANAPQPARAAAREPSSVESHAAAAIEAFAAGEEQKAKGDPRAAARHYREAAAANIAALDALDRSSADYLELAQTLAKRVIKAYSVGLLVVDDPTVRADAWSWCTHMEATFDSADAPGFAEIQEACTQWQPPPSEPPDTPKPSVVVTVPVPPDAPAPSSSKAWKGLAIAGGSTLAGGTIFLVLALVGAVRQRSIMREDDDCTLPYDDRCDKLINTGLALRPLSAASAIAGTLLTGTGAVLLTFAMRRRAGKVTLAPALHAQFIGLTLRGRF